MTPEDFDALFDTFRHSAYRLEALRAYQVGGLEEARFEAFQRGQPLPERSVRTSPWVARIAVSTVKDGRDWSRTRVVDQPLTPFQRYQLESYRESQAVGEAVGLVERSRVGDVGSDFWLLDGGTDSARAVVMRYDDDGHWLGADLVTDTAELVVLEERRQAVQAIAVPLNEFLAGTHG